MPTLRVPRRLRGPATSGNGGCACGLVAHALGRPVEVTLRAPPPLDAPLELRGLELLDGERPIATATDFDEPLDVIASVDFATAQAASASFRCRDHHPLPECFVCGTAREDGLRIWPGPVPGAEGVAAPWVPDASIADGDGLVPVEIVWGALDCPGYFGLGPDAPFMLLGRMAARVHRRPRVGEACVVRGWRLGGSGRKALAGSALWSGDELLGVARATWIQVDPARTG
jgi:hypothetical protein